MSGGRVIFVGCGPGAEDLLTVRAVRALQRADVVIWNAGILDRQALVEHTDATTEIVEWPPATQRELLAVYDRAITDDLVVVRLKGGDPTLFGALEEDIATLRERGVAYEIVPGVSALAATAAALGHEVASNGLPLLLVDAAALTSTAPTTFAVAAHGAARSPDELQRALLDRGLPASTPCTVAIEVSRRDETLLSCPLDELAETIQDMGLGVLTLVLAGHTRPGASALESG
jgi:precorrin-4 methylase